MKKQETQVAVLGVALGLGVLAGVLHTTWSKPRIRPAFKGLDRKKKLYPMAVTPVGGRLKSLTKPFDPNTN